MDQTYPMSLPINLSFDLIASRPLIYKSKDFPVCSEGVSWSNAADPFSTLPSTLIKKPVEKCIDNP
jgi:hypothetical protein